MKLLKLSFQLFPQRLQSWKKLDQLSLSAAIHKAHRKLLIIGQFNSYTRLTAFCGSNCLNIYEFGNLNNYIDAILLFFFKFNIGCDCNFEEEVFIRLKIIENFYFISTNFNCVFNKIQNTLQHFIYIKNL